MSDIAHRPPCHPGIAQVPIAYVRIQVRVDGKCCADARCVPRSVGVATDPEARADGTSTPACAASRSVWLGDFDLVIVIRRLLAYRPILSKTVAA